MKLRSIVSVFAMILCTLASYPANAAGLLNQIESKKIIRIAVPTDYPPFGFAGSDMKPQGIDVEMAELIAKN